MADDPAAQGASAPPQPDHEPQQQPQQVAPPVAEAAPDADAAPSTGRLGKKRKVALFLGYVGAGYYGMQRNPPHPTIEAELERALVAAGCIAHQNASSFNKVHWMRAARTDKGVSAVCQVVSARLVMVQNRRGDEGEGEDEGGQEQQQEEAQQQEKEGQKAAAAEDNEEEGAGQKSRGSSANPKNPSGGDHDDPVVARVNAALPPAVRVYGWRRVTEGFDARKWCDRRRYEYVLPAWVFDRELFTRPLLAEDAAAGAGQTLAANPSSASAAISSAAQSSTLNSVTDVTVDRSGLPPREIKALRAAVRAAEAARAPVDQDALDAIFARYQGTHNFHNFTAKVDPSTAEAKRHILYFRCEGVVDVEGGGGRWVKLAVLGQSFMLHQIRKMVGLAAAVARGIAPLEALDAALDPDRDYAVPMAPALGLLLDEAFFDGYNQRWASLHGPISLAPFREQAEALKRTGVYPHMASLERQGSVYALWARSLEVGAPRGYKFERWPTRPKVRSLGGAFGSSKRARSAGAGGKRGEGGGGEAEEAEEEGGGSGGGGGGGEDKEERATPAAKRAKVTQQQREQPAAAAAAADAPPPPPQAAAATPAPAAAAGATPAAEKTPVINPAEAQALLGDLYDEL